MRPFAIWLAAVALAISAGIAVPYGVLAGGGPSFAIFGFWCGFGLAVVALIAVGVSGWRD